MNNPLRYLKLLIEQEWTVSRSVRDVDVPEPTVVVARADEQQQEMGTGDYVVVQPRGDNQQVPLINRDKRRRYRAYLVARSADRTLDGTFVDGEARVYGPVDETTLEQEQFAGMTGELEYIIDENAAGGPDYGLTIPTGGWERLEPAFGVYAARMPVELRRLERDATAV